MILTLYPFNEEGIERVKGFDAYAKEDSSRVLDFFISHLTWISNYHAK